MDERIKRIKEMQKMTANWDGSAAQAQEVISQLKPLVAYLGTMEAVPYSPEEALLLQAIITKQQEMIAVLKVAKTEVAAEMRAMNKKEALVKNYLYPKKQPTFVNHHL